MKHRILALVLAALMALALLTGCGGGSAPAKTEAQSAPAAQSAAEASSAAQSAAEASAAASSAAQSAAEASEGGKTAAAFSPYAWLGLQDMPECPYLDTLCTYHYYREYTSYIMGMSTKSTEAVDGVNTFKGTDTTRTYSIDGTIITFNDYSKTYTTYELGSSLVEQSAASIEKHKADGTNMVGRVFVTTGTGVIPEYSETENDKTEYEYYEYNYPSYEEYGTRLVERFYMKDGDVFATYMETYSDGKLLTGLTEVMQSMSGEIPEGTLEIPSTDGYEEFKLDDN